MSKPKFKPCSKCGTMIAVFTYTSADGSRKQSSRQCKDCNAKDKKQ